VVLPWFTARQNPFTSTALAAASALYITYYHQHNQLPNIMVPARSSRLNNFLVDNYESRANLLSMLRPLDIISLKNAAAISITTSEKKKYLVWWKQIFFDMRWADILQKTSCAITIVGHDFSRINHAIISNNYLDTKTSKILIVIGKTELEANQFCAESRLVLASSDTRISWHNIPRRNNEVFAFHIDQAAEDLQTCVISLMKDTYCALDYTWCKALYTVGEPLKPYLIGPGKPYSYSSEAWVMRWYQLHSDATTILAGPTTSFTSIVDSLYIQIYILRIYIDSDRGFQPLVMQKDDEVAWKFEH
jgi:hypothetical protein